VAFNEILLYQSLTNAPGIYPCLGLSRRFLFLAQMYG